MPLLRLPAAIVTAVAASACHAVFLGMVDDFEDGTAMNWGGGNPTNIPSGGPFGVDDNYMCVYQGPPLGYQHLACKNEAQWTGDYSGQGIVVLEADMLNLSTIPLELRVVMFGPNYSRVTSTNYYTLPQDSIWHKVAFPVRASDMTMVYNLGDTIASTLAGCTKLMIRYDPGSPSSSGTNPPAGITETSFGLDNIRASAFASVNPTSGLTFIRGYQLGGDIASLQSSDDNRLIGRPGPVLVTTLAPLLIEIKTQATLTSFSQLRVRIESSCTATSITQKVFLYDYVAAAYVEIGSTTPMTTTDNVVEYVASGTLSRFRSSTGEMKAQVSYKANGAVLVFPWQAKIDYFVWTLWP